MTDRAALEATWQRIRPLYCLLTLDQALKWPAMAIVIETAARAFDARRQNIEHPALRAMANWYSEIPPEIAVQIKRARRRKPQPQPEPDLFARP